MLKFGWSKVNIGVDGPVGITGQFHERISKGLYDESLVTVLVIDDGKTASIMMSGDLVSVGDGIIFDVREATRAKNSEIPVENIIFNATHTHCSPRYMKMGHLGYDKAPHDEVDYVMPEEYRKIFVERVSNAIVEAYESRSEGSYSYGYGYAVVAHHRRPTYFDDLRERPGIKGPSSLHVDKHARMYGKTDDPMFSEYEGNVDSAAYFMFTFDKNEKLTGAIINVPCPSQNSEMEEFLTGDYWVQVRAMLKEKYGEIYVLSQCASAGDMSPRTLHARPAENRKYALKYEGMEFPGVRSSREMFNRIEIAERIVAAFDDTYRWASKEKFADSKLSHVVKNVKLPAWKVTEEQYIAAKEEYEKVKDQKFVCTDNKRADFETNTKLSTVFARFESLMSRYERNVEFYEPELHFVALGDIAFVSNPFELYIAYQHRIQARSPFVQTFAVQLAASTSCSGYLCTQRAADNMGYSANLYSCSVSPEGGSILVEETLKELEALHGEK